MNRAELLDRLTDATIDGTLADTSLRNLAAAAATSARMLIYHFESREALIRAVAASIADRWRAVVTEGSVEPEGDSTAVELSRLWHSISARRNERLIRALVQIQGRSVSGADGLDESAAAGASLLRSAVEEIIERSSIDGKLRRSATSLLAFAMWGAVEHIVLSRDRVVANEAVLGLIERLDVS